MEWNLNWVLFWCSVILGVLFKSKTCWYGDTPFTNNLALQEIPVPALELLLADGL